MIDPQRGTKPHRGPDGVPGRPLPVVCSHGRVRWSVVVPAKRLAVAKTRLRPVTVGASDAAEAHTRLVLALLADTVAATLATPSVVDVVVVTDDPAAEACVRTLGAQTVPDVPDRGLNPALLHGAGTTTTEAVAALSSDLPALRPAELAAALERAGGLPRAFVADAHGSGTTLLTAVGVPLEPRFGQDSAAVHEAGGAVRLDGDWPGLRHDVDTEADLAAAAALGLGRHTAAALPATGDLGSV